MVKFEKELIKALKDYKGDLSKYDALVYKSFHVGIAHHDIEEKFSEIKYYLKKFNKKFKVKFDKVYLIKKVNNKWIVQKEYFLQ